MVFWYQNSLQKVQSIYFWYFREENQVLFDAMVSKNDSLLEVRIIKKITFSQRRLEKRTFPPIEGLQNTCFSPFFGKSIVRNYVVKNVDYQRMCL